MEIVMPPDHPAHFKRTTTLIPTQIVTENSKNHSCNQ